MGKFQDNNYIVIQGFMISELCLKGNELLVYAIIYGFSQDEDNWFTGSLNYIMSAIGCNSKNTVINTIKSLIEKGLIIKENQIINGVTFCKYKCNKNLEIFNSEIVVQNFGGVVQNLDGGSANFAPNNNIYNKKKDNNNKLLLSKEKNENVNFKPPTIDEVKQYCEDRNNNIDAEYFIDYYQSIGWRVGKNKMKDWKACVRTWERNNKLNNKDKTMEENQDRSYIDEFGVFHAY